MDTHDVYAQLLTFLRPPGRRLRLRLSIELFARLVWMILAASVLVLLIGRLWPMDGYRLIAGGIIVASLLGWIVFSLARKIRPFTVARRADSELGLRDRLATALVLSDPHHPVPLAFDRALVAFQIDDALAVAQSIEPRRAVPMHLQRTSLWRAALALLAGIGLLVLPNPMDAIVTERAQVSETARVEAAKLEQLVEEVAANQTLTPEDRDELLRQMRKLIEQLKSNPGDAKQALADLAKFQEQLRAKLDPAAPTEAAAMEALAQQLAQLTGAQDEPKDAAEAAKLLEQLASELDKLSPEQREALAGALQRAAAQTAGSNPDLAGALSAMAQSARSGETGQQARQAGAQAAHAMQQSADQQALQQALARLLNQSESSQRALAQASTREGQAHGQGHPGAGQGRQGQGEGPGK